MKTIELKEAHEIIRNCSAIIVDDDFLIYSSLTELEGHDDNEFMYLSWDMGDNDYSAKFNERLNFEIDVEGNSMYLFDISGDKYKITPLFPQEIEST